jgi:hypothetical protein
MNVQLIAEEQIPNPFLYHKNSDEVPYKNSIVRTILPQRKISESLNYDMIENGTIATTYEVFQIASGFITNKKDKNTKKQKESFLRKREIAIGYIYQKEDDLFINGEQFVSVSGISSTKTIRYDLLTAIKEFNPSAIITSSKFLNIPNISIFRNSSIPRYVHYLIPKELKSSDAEFVISEDIEMEETFDQSNDTVWNGIREWVAIEIHNPNVFIKVIRRS